MRAVPFAPDQQIVDRYPHDLPPSVHKAVIKRQAEFCAGRMAAMAALSGLGAPAGRIDSRPDRSPDWPGGTLGSITHTDGMAAAVVGWTAEFDGIGLDCEGRVPAERASHMAERILCAEEQALCPPDMPLADFFTLAFSAKETFYKAHYPQAGLHLGFHSARIVTMTTDQIGLQDMRSASAPVLTVFYHHRDGIFTTLGVRPRTP